MAPTLVQRALVRNKTTSRPNCSCEALGSGDNSGVPFLKYNSHPLKLGLQAIQHLHLLASSLDTGLTALHRGQILQRDGG